VHSFEHTFRTFWLSAAQVTPGAFHMQDFSATRFAKTLGSRFMRLYFIFLLAFFSGTHNFPLFFLRVKQFN
jgi:hypothetical protein